jgi:hypothetical protein
LNDCSASFLKAPCNEHLHDFRTQAGVIYLTQILYAALAVTGLAFLFIVVYRAVFVAGVDKVRKPFTRLHIPEVIGEEIAIRLPVGDAKNVIVSNSPMHDNEILPTVYLGEQFLGHDYDLSGLCTSLERWHPKLCGDTVREKYLSFASYGWMSSSGSVIKVWNIIYAKNENRGRHSYFLRRSFPRVYEMSNKEDRGTYYIPLQLVAYRSKPSALVLPHLPLNDVDLFLHQRIGRYSIGNSGYSLATQNLSLIRHGLELEPKEERGYSTNYNAPHSRPKQSLRGRERITANLKHFLRIVRGLWGLRPSWWGLWWGLWWGALAALSSRLTAGILWGCDSLGGWDYGRYCGSLSDRLRIEIAILLFLITSIFFYHAFLAIGAV